MEGLLTSQNLIGLVTLTSMEIILGIDNIVFIAILSARLPPAQQPAARRLGLVLAMLMRIGLLFAITWVMKLTSPLFSVLDHSFSGRDLILGLGGLFLIGKATTEIHHKLEHHGEPSKATGQKSSFTGIVLQIMVLDVVFSLDSVITAVGMVQAIPVMIVAVILSVAVMLIFSGSISDFILKYPTMKILALSFLLLIGVMLLADSLGQHIDKRYAYFAMAFSLFVELLNLKLHSKSAAPVSR